MNRLWGLSDRRTAAKVSNFVRSLQNRPLSSLLVACIAVSFYLVGLLHGRTSKAPITFASLYTSSGSEVCPPCDIPEGLKALIPPMPSKYEDLLKSEALRWLTPWDKYDFESASISTKNVDNLWEYMVSRALAGLHLRRPGKNCQNHCQISKSRYLLQFVRAICRFLVWGNQLGTQRKFDETSVKKVQNT